MGGDKKPTEKSTAAGGEFRRSTRLLTMAQGAISGETSSRSMDPSPAKVPPTKGSSDKPQKKEGSSAKSNKGKGAKIVSKIPQPNQEVPAPPSSMLKSNHPGSKSNASSKGEGGDVQVKESEKTAVGCPVSASVTNPVEVRIEEINPMPDTLTTPPIDDGTTGEPSQMTVNSGHPEEDDRNGDDEGSMNDVVGSGIYSQPSSPHSGPASTTSSKLDSQLTSSSKAKSPETGGKNTVEGPRRKRRGQTLKATSKFPKLIDDRSEADIELALRKNNQAQLRKKINKNLKKDQLYEDALKEHFREKQQTIDNKISAIDTTLKRHQEEAKKYGTDLDQAVVDQLQAKKVVLVREKTDRLADEEEMLKHGPGKSRAPKRKKTNNKAATESTGDEMDDDDVPEQASTSTTTTKLPPTKASTTKKANKSNQAATITQPRSSEMGKKVIQAAVSSRRAVPSLPSSHSVPTSAPTSQLVTALPVPFSPLVRPTTYAGFVGLNTLFEGKKIFLGDLDSYKEEIFRCSKDVEFQAGEIVQEEGCIFHNFIIVIDGALRLVKGNKYVGQLGSYDCYGRFAIHRCKPSTVGIVAQAHSKLLLVEAATFREVTKVNGLSIYPTRGYFLELLIKCPYLDQLKEQNLMDLAKSMQLVAYETNEIVHLQQSAFIIVTGFGLTSGPAFPNTIYFGPHNLCADMDRYTGLSYEDILTTKSKLLVAAIPLRLLLECLHGGGCERLLAPPFNQATFPEVHSVPATLYSFQTSTMQEQHQETDYDEAISPGSERHAVFSEPGSPSQLLGGGTEENQFNFSKSNDSADSDAISDKLENVHTRSMLEAHTQQQEATETPKQPTPELNVRTEDVECSASSSSTGENLKMQTEDDDMTKDTYNPAHAPEDVTTG